MTAHPIPENAYCWWLVSGKQRRLHAVPATISPQQMQDAIDDARPLPARAACGMRRRWWMPGIFSRLGGRRCTPCCTALGIPAGHGTPCNEASIKESIVSGPTSTPRGEHTPRPGTTWETEMVRVEQLLDEDAPAPRPNRATRRALARNRPATPAPAQPDEDDPPACTCTYGERCPNCRD